MLDFGIAKVLSESDSVTRAFEETGGTVQAFTARYGAPEQFSRRFGATGPWTDVFALSLVFIEVVLGAPALDGTDAAQLFVASSDKLLRPTPRARGFDPGDAVEAVLATALSVDPRERYPNATLFWQALTIAARQEPARLSVRPPIIDDSRPTRELSGADASGPVAESRGFSAHSSGSRLVSSSGPTHDAADPSTELSSSQGIRAVDPAAPKKPRRLLRKFLTLVGVAALAAAGTGAAVLWMNREAPNTGAGAGHASIKRSLEKVLPRSRPDADSPGVASSGDAAPSSSGERALAPSGSASPNRPPGRILGTQWEGTQFRQVAEGTLADKQVWLETFRVVRRPEAATSLDGAFRACGEVGLSLCTESQWLLACTAFPEVGKDRSFTDSVEVGGIVERGGDGCAARQLLPPESAARGDHRERLGLCCERAIGMSTKNLKNQFLSSTANVLKKLETALNQRDAVALEGLLDEKVMLDGVERSKASVVALLSQTFKAAPDLIVTHEACDVAVQANKVVKRSKRGRKLTTYETNSWSASCQQVRHQLGETVPASAEYLFSPASKLRGISAKNQATE